MIGGALEKQREYSKDSNDCNRNNQNENNGVFPLSPLKIMEKTEADFSRRPKYSISKPSPPRRF